MTTEKITKAEGGIGKHCPPKPAQRAQHDDNDQQQVGGVLVRESRGPEEAGQLAHRAAFICDTNADMSYIDGKEKQSD